MLSTHNDRHDSYRAFERRVVAIRIGAPSRRTDETNTGQCQPQHQSTGRDGDHDLQELDSAEDGLRFDERGGRRRAGAGKVVDE